MRILPPITVTGAMITACNVAETAPAAYDAGTSYSLGATVSNGSAGGDISVYISLQGSNMGNTPASSPTYWQFISITYSEWDSGTTYVIGAKVIIAATHKVYESLQNSNTNKAPATETTYWLDLGSTNRFNMFDSKVGTQTSGSEEITLTITPGQVVDSIAFLDVAATTIELTMTDPTEGVVYTETLDLVTGGRVIDGYTYFFEPIILTDTAIMIGIPPYGSASLAITITNPGGTAAVGTLALGLQQYLGGTMQEPTIGIIDYSKKEVDSFGNYSITVRAYSKRMTCRLLLDNTALDETQRILAGYRSTALIWIGAEEYSSLIVYGFYKNFNIDIPLPNNAYCSLEIEGLV